MWHEIYFSKSKKVFLSPPRRRGSKNHGKRVAIARLRFPAEGGQAAGVLSASGGQE